MKRIVPLLLCLSLVLCSVSALALSPAQAVGRWYFVAIDGQGIPGEHFIELNRNKSVTLVTGGRALVTDGLAWELDGDSIWVTHNGDYIMNARYEDGKLTLSTDQLSMISGSDYYYTYTLARELVSYYTPEAVEVAVEDVFYGIFVPYLQLKNNAYTELNGMQDRVKIEYAQLTAMTPGGNAHEYLTDFTGGELVMDEEGTRITIRATTDPDVLLVIAWQGETPVSTVYMRREGSEGKREAPAVPATPQPTLPPAIPEPTPLPTEAPAAPSFPGMVQPAATQAPQATAAPAPAAPSFPGMVQPAATQAPQATAAPAPAVPSFPGMVRPAAPADPAAELYGRYEVYKDVLANGRTLDMSAYGQTAEISASGIIAVAYGQTLSVPCAWQDGRLTADISALYPDYGFAAAVLQDGELVVTLSNAAGEVGETLYLRKGK